MSLLQGIEARGAIPNLVPADVLPPNPAFASNQISTPDVSAAKAGEVATANAVPTSIDPSLGTVVDEAV